MRCAPPHPRCRRPLLHCRRSRVNRRIDHRSAARASPGVRAAAPRLPSQTGGPATMDRITTSEKNRVVAIMEDSIERLMLLSYVPDQAPEAVLGELEAGPYEVFRRHWELERRKDATSSEIADSARAVCRALRDSPRTFAALQRYRRPGRKSRRAAAPPRLRRGYFLATSRGAAAAATRGYFVATSRGGRDPWLFRGARVAAPPRLRPVAISWRPSRSAPPRLRRGRSAKPERRAAGTAPTGPRRAATSSRLY